MGADASLIEHLIVQLFINFRNYAMWSQFPRVRLWVCHVAHQTIDARSLLLNIELLRAFMDVFPV